MSSFCPLHRLPTFTGLLRLGSSLVSAPIPGAHNLLGCLGFPWIALSSGQSDPGAQDLLVFLGFDLVDAVSDLRAARGISGVAQLAAIEPTELRRFDWAAGLSGSVPDHLRVQT